MHYTAATLEQISLGAQLGTTKDGRMRSICWVSDTKWSTLDLTTPAGYRIVLIIPRLPNLSTIGGQSEYSPAKSQ